LKTDYQVFACLFSFRRDWKWNQIAYVLADSSSFQYIR